MKKYSWISVILLISFIISLISCTTWGGKKILHNQTALTLEKAKIKRMFTDWQKREITTGNYSDSCNPEWFSNHQIKETPDSLMFGFPTDSIEYNFSFADLNSDGKLDGLVTFTPDQCDGGNAGMWIQIKVFLISNQNTYWVTDTIQIDKFAATDFDSLGFYWLDSIGSNKIYGTYKEFSNTDGHCCPSINRSVIFDYTNKKLIEIGKNVSIQ